MSNTLAKSNKNNGAYVTNAQQICYGLENSQDMPRISRPLTIGNKSTQKLSFSQSQKRKYYTIRIC